MIWRAEMTENSNFKEVPLRGDLWDWFVDVQLVGTRDLLILFASLRCSSFGKLLCVWPALSYFSNIPELVTNLLKQKGSQSSIHHMFTSFWVSSSCHVTVNDKTKALLCPDQQKDRERLSINNIYQNIRVIWNNYVSIRQLSRKSVLARTKSLRCYPCRFISRCDDNFRIAGATSIAGANPGAAPAEKLHLGEIAESFVHVQPLLKNLQNTRKLCENLVEDQCTELFCLLSHIPSGCKPMANTIQEKRVSRMFSTWQKQHDCQRVKPTNNLSRSRDAETHSAHASNISL